ncbi:MAG: hypothetical protein HZB50_04370 [Chloroflexi bacterium]|nr:hypothetical protein [Chloroflexota bacterium]
MKFKIFSVLILVTLTSCAMPVSTTPLPTALPSATPQLTLIAPATFTPVPLLTQIATSVPTSASTGVVPFCDDPRARDLIVSFSKAIANQDGALLSSLVSPSIGMDVRFYRNGNVVNYDVEHAKFVFETTFQADWGLSFGSGLPTLGAFHEVILPTLQVVFTPTAQLACNQIKLGGASYNTTWPYPSMNYYSVHFPGTDAYGGLDWQTWIAGMDMSTGTPKLAALIHFVWEP